eukprot:4421351-Amphidinium_carterae.4
MVWTFLAVLDALFLSARHKAGVERRRPLSCCHVVLTILQRLFMRTLPRREVSCVLGAGCLHDIVSPRTDNDEPKLVKSKIDKADPNRAKLRSDNADLFKRRLTREEESLEAKEVER